MSGEEVTQPNCNVCGRKMRKVTWHDPEAGVDRFLRWQCVKVSWASDEGWEHD